MEGPEPKPELFQVTAVFGNFSSRKEAAEFREWLMNSTYTKNDFISGLIKGSFSK